VPLTVFSAHGTILLKTTFAGTSDSFAELKALLGLANVKGSMDADGWDEPEELAPQRRTAPV
jgi:hypothetical protein